MHYVGLIIAIFVIDQVTKWSIHNNMNLYQSIPVIENFFYLTYITNDGMAFGLTLPGGQATLSILSIIMTFVLIYFFWIEKDSHFTIKIGLSLIIAGAFGNLIDRLIAGKVIDFLHIKIGSYWEWYVFNIADTSVSIGMVFFIIHSFYFFPRTLASIPILDSIRGSCSLQYDILYLNTLMTNHKSLNQREVRELRRFII